MAINNYFQGKSSLSSLATALGNGIADFANNTAQSAIQGVMGHNANLASAQGQSNAMDFNASQANAATQQNLASMASQYDYNSSQAAIANDFTANMWQQTADWNEKMWQKQADFNAEQAQIQRDWQERMANTQYQRAIADMSKSGLNPILAVTGGGVGTGVPGGSTASVGGASMSSAQGAMASGGLLSAESGAVGGYQGQGEFTGGVLSLLSQALGGMSSAISAFANMGEAGENIKEAVGNLFTENPKDIVYDAAETIKQTTEDHPIADFLLKLTPGIGAGYAAISDIAKSGLPQWIITQLKDSSVKKWNNFTKKAEAAIDVQKAANIIKNAGNKYVNQVKNYFPKG